MLCEFSKDLSQGLEVKLFCIPRNEVCLFYRYCTTKKCIVHTDNYNSCSLRAKTGGDQMAYKKSETETPSPIEENLDTETIIEETPKPPKQKSQTKICNIIYKSDKKFAINFNECGLSFQDPSPNKTDKIEVTYIGEFGTKSFEILKYKFI